MRRMPDGPEATPIDVRGFERFLLDDLEPSCRVGRVGCYARQMGGERVDASGVAGMALILWTLDRLELDDSRLRRWHDAFSAIDDAEICELEPWDGSHPDEHAVALAVAAMRLLGEDLAHPVAVGEAAIGTRDDLVGRVLALADDLTGERRVRRAFGGEHGVLAATDAVILVAKAQRALGTDLVLTSRPWRVMSDVRIPG
jgi:hypothetical protein